MFSGAESDALHPTCRGRRATAAATFPDGGSLRADDMSPRLASVADNTAHYYGSYLPLLVILVVGTVLVVAMFTSNRLLRPTLSTPEKLLTYECGVDPVGEGWAQNHVRYYVFAYLYVIFAVDAVFLFPWATVFDGLGWVSVGEMGVFIGFIAVGLVYAWRKGVLTWT
jgi:NADH-quinone oxidoreductase subunit A